MAPGFAMPSSRATKPAIANEICDRIAASVRVSLIAQSAGWTLAQMSTSKRSAPRTQASKASPWLDHPDHWWLAHQITGREAGRRQMSDRCASTLDVPSSCPPLKNFFAHREYQPACWSLPHIGCFLRHGEPAALSCPFQEEEVTTWRACAQWFWRRRRWD
jgi:hypothetical protein